MLVTLAITLAAVYSTAQLTHSALISRKWWETWTDRGLASLTLVCLWTVSIWAVIAAWRTSL